MKLMTVGAHPDDCEWMAGGTAALARKAGWEVVFVSVTDGSAGHHEMKPRSLAARRLKEARTAASRIGATYRSLGEPDGRLFVTDRTTARVVRAIRKLNPDVVITHRACDYHRDHRYTGELVLDASFVLQVPSVYPKPKAMDRVPVILYACDSFSEGPRFRADMVVDTSSVLDIQTRMIMDHESQFREWIPWLNGQRQVGRRRPVADLNSLARSLKARPRLIAKRFASELKAKYSREADSAEAFQVSEYGRRLTGEEAGKFFPF